MPHKTRRIDLTQLRFGSLIAIECVGLARGTRGNALWRCACDCGGAAVVKSCHLRGGNTRTCGCRMGHRVRVSAPREPKIKSARPLIEKHCPISGTRFFCRSTARIYCSGECSTVAAKRRDAVRQRRRDERNPETRRWYHFTNREAIRARRKDTLARQAAALKVAIELGIIIDPNRQRKETKHDAH